MGYQRKRRVYRLDFEGDPVLDGLEVRARSLNLGEFLATSRLAGMAAGGVTPEDVDVFEGLFATFAGALVSWNLEDDEGRPVPATLDGVKAQDVDFVMPIVNAWFKAIAGVASPLGPPSSAGVPSLEASIPMEVK